MWSTLQSPLALAARILLAVLFISSGWGKLAGFEATVGYIASMGLPLPQLGAVLAIVVELGAGLALLFGLRTRWAALALAVFTVLAALLFHNYWAVPPEQLMMQQIQFMKNLAITGGLLAIAAFGAGAWAIDGRRVTSSVRPMRNLPT
jgi:putative oxidoreductase